MEGDWPTIDLTRRRFLFGLAAVPVVAVAAKHFIMPKVPNYGILGDYIDNIYKRQFVEGRLTVEHVHPTFRQIKLIGDSVMTDRGRATRLAGRKWVRAPEYDFEMPGAFRSMPEWDLPLNHSFYSALKPLGEI